MTVCPYLGKFDDHDTPILYPSEINGCTQGSKLFIPVLDHQQSFCLSDYQTCPAFLDNRKANTIQAMELPRARGMNRYHYGRFVLVLVLVGLGALWLLNLRNGEIGTLAQVDEPVLPTAALRVIVTTTVPAAEEAIASPIPSITMTPTKRSTDTRIVPTRIPVVGLETPIGKNVQFIIHKLKAGDSFALLEEQYGTTESAIKQVNYELPVPLWENWLIVIPIKSLSVGTDIPAFQAYQVSGGDIVAESLAQELDIRTDQFLLYNDLYPGQVLPDGSWVLIPHARKQ